MNVLAMAGIDKETARLLGPWSMLESITRSDNDTLVSQEIDLDSKHGNIRVKYRTGSVAIVSREDGRAMTVEDVYRLAEPRRVRLAKIAAAQLAAKDAYAAYDELTAKWRKGLDAHLATILESKPELRKVKRGRKVGKIESRAMALDLGFSPHVHGMYWEDPADAKLAEAERDEALKEWDSRVDQATAEFKRTNPRPPRPSIEPWHVYSTEAADKIMPQ
jgi:hypothetical protein